MLDFKGIALTAVKKVSENSPAILTAMGVAGVVTTAVLAVKATPKALEHLEEAAEVRRKTDSEFEVDFFSPLEKAQIVWKDYAPSVVIGAVTAGCVIGVNSVNTRRNAALASAYSLAETTLREYQEKVVEHIGEREERKVRDKVSEARMHNDPVSSKEVIITGSGDMLCYDALTGRYFQSNMEALRRAENACNADIIAHMYVSQNEFYNHICLPTIPYGDDLGWTIGHMLDLDFATMMSDEPSPKPCLVVNHRNLPKAEFYRGY